MTEPKPTYLDTETIVNQAYTIALKHVGMISELVARRIGKNNSDVVRQAVEFFYTHLNDNDPGNSIS